MTRSTCLLCVLFLCGLGDARLASAQEPSPPTAPASPTPAAAPPHPAFHGSINLGLSAANGAQEQRNYQFALSLSRPVSGTGQFVASVSHQFQKVTFPSQSILADRTSVAVGFDREVTRRTAFMVRSMYLRDKTLLVNSRFEELGGYGLHLRNPSRTSDIILMPGLSAYRDNLVYFPERDWRVGYGFLEKFQRKFDKVWSLENSFRFRQDFTDSRRSIESVVDLTGMVTKTLGLQVEYQYNYESVVPPRFPNYLSIVVVGVRLRF